MAGVEPTITLIPSQVTAPHGSHLDINKKSSIKLITELLME
jgi:hypothetical protein